MITFDDSPGLLRPTDMVKPVADFPGTAVVTFTDDSSELLLSLTEHTELTYLSAGYRLTVYRCRYKGGEFAFYRTLIGAAGAAGLLEEIVALGAKKVLHFGSCGVLDDSIAGGGLILPTAAYRDEGTSYHYLPDSDYLELKTVGRLSDIFDELNVPYIKTKVWTTDALYRETADKAKQRRSEGCGAVDMECAALSAVGMFRGVETYQFLYAEDCLGEEKWERRILGAVPADMREAVVRIALETAIRL